MVWLRITAFLVSCFSPKILPPANLCPQEQKPGCYEHYSLLHTRVLHTKRYLNTRTSLSRFCPLGAFSFHTRIHTHTHTETTSCVPLIRVRQTATEGSWLVLFSGNFRFSHMVQGCGALFTCVCYHWPDPHGSFSNQGQTLTALLWLPGIPRAYRGV